MPVVLPNTTTTSEYRGVSLGGGGLYSRGLLVIANNAVALRITTATETGQERVTEYPYVTPTVLPLSSGSMFPGKGAPVSPERIVGVEIKDAAAGTHAQVSGWLLEAGLAGPDIGSPFTSSVSASGVITPGLSAVQVQKNGVLIGTEPILDYVDVSGARWAIADDVANTRVTVAAAGVTVSAFSAGPPVGPSTGDIWYATGVDGATNTTWEFVYTGSAWAFIGGPPVVRTGTAVLTYTGGGSVQVYTGFTGWPAGRSGNYAVQGGIVGGDPALGGSHQLQAYPALGTSTIGVNGFFFSQSGVTDYECITFGGSGVASIGNVFNIVVLCGVNNVVFQSGYLNVTPITVS